MQRLPRLLFLALVLFVGRTMVAQELVTIHGTVVVEEKDHAFYDLMVVNKRLRSGSFGNTDGTFTALVQRTDTLLIGAGGYVTVPITVRDSVVKSEYFITVHLQQWTIEIPAVKVMPQRTLEEIQKDIASLGYDERDFKLGTVDALQSPITFLYQEFSKRERSKRLVAELRNNDRKRDLLRELLRKYAQYDIINLNDEAFDDFIDFCVVPDEVIKGLSQYDFLMYVKMKYDLYSSLGPTRTH